MNYGKVLSLSALALLSMGTIGAKKLKTIETHKLQIVLNPADPEFDYILNTGCLQGDTDCVFLTDFFATRPDGSSNHVRAEIYPGGTVSKKQNDYTVNKHGKPLTNNNSIGTWECNGNGTREHIWMDMPDTPTLFEIADWDLFFKYACPDDKMNILFTRVSAFSGTFDPAHFKVATSGTAGVLNGTGCNEGAHGNYTFKLYIAPDFETKPAVLIKLKFDQPITITVKD